VDAVALLEQLSNAFGPSGHEDEVRAILTDVVKPLVDEVRVDRVGNLVATRRGRREDVLLLDAHMDEVGFLVSYIDDAGFLRLSPLGGWDARVLPGHALTIAGRDGRRIKGVIGTIPPHVTSEAERSKAWSLDDLFVDVGGADGVEIGSPAVPASIFERLDDDLVIGKAFDDRAGCTIVASVLDALSGTDLDMTLVAAFTTSEELGLRGARAVADQVRPAVALALEGTTAVDVPGVGPTKRLAALGTGPALTIADRSAVADRRVLALLEEVGTKNTIPFARKLPGGGGTDAAAIQPAGDGVLVGVVSVPCRYIHAPLSMLKLSDLDDAIRLTTVFCREASCLL
jgi:endoglucanase